MNNSEKYGIELDANYSNAVKGIEKVANTAEKATQIIDDLEENMENAFDNMSLKQLEKELERTQNQLDVLSKKDYKISLTLGKADEELARVQSDFKNSMEKATTQVAKDWENEIYDKYANDIQQKYAGAFEKAREIDDETNQLLQKQELLRQKISQVKAEQNSLGNVYVKTTGDGSKALGILQNKFTKITTITNNFGKRFSNMITNNLKNIRRLVLSMFGIQTAWRAITRAANAYKQIDDEISGKMNAAWIGLGSFLAPALEYISDLVIKLVSYLNKLVKYLTGVDFLARAIAKSTAKAAKSTNNALAGIDQITNLQGAGGVADDWTPYFKGFEDVDISPIIKFVDKAKEILSRIFDPVQQAWEEKGPLLMQSLSTTFGNIKSLGGHVFDDMLSVWEGGAGQRISIYVFEMWTNISDIIGNLAKAFDNAWTHAGTGKSILNSISGIIENVLKFVNMIGDSLKKWTASPEFQEALNSISELLDDILGLVDRIGKKIIENYEKYIKPTLDEKVLPLLSKIITILAKLGSIGLLVFTTIGQYLEKHFKPIIDLISDGLDFILTILNDIADFVIDVLKGNWEKAWKDMKKSVEDLFNPLQKVKNYFNDMKNMSFGEKTLKIGGDFGGLINGIKDISKAMGGWTGKIQVGTTAIAEELGAWVARKIRSFDVGTNYVPNDQLAMVHKGEAIIPKQFNKAEFFNNVNNDDVISAINDLKQTLIEKDMNAYIGEKEVGQASINYINNQNRIMGRSVI